jgi:hypothetical protein
VTNVWPRLLARATDSADLAVEESGSINLELQSRPLIKDRNRVRAREQDAAAMASKPGGKENAHAASTTRFGYTGGAKPKARGAAAAAAAAAAAPPARKKAKPAIVPLREADEAAGPNTDADPYDLQKTAIEAMPDDAEQWHEVTRKFKQANKGAKWDLKSKCAPNKLVRRPCVRCAPADACMHGAVWFGHRAEKNEELIPLMKSILNKMREQVRPPAACPPAHPPLPTLTPRTHGSSARGSTGRPSRCNVTWTQA